MRSVVISLHENLDPLDRIIRTAPLLWPDDEVRPAIGTVLSADFIEESGSSVRTDVSRHYVRRFGCKGDFRDGFGGVIGQHEVRRHTECTEVKS